MLCVHLDIRDPSISIPIREIDAVVPLGLCPIRRLISDDEREENEQ